MTTVDCEYTVPAILPTEFDLKQGIFYLVGKQTEESWWVFAATVTTKALYVFVSEDDAKDFLFMSDLHKRGYQVYPVSFAYIQRLLDRHDAPYVFASAPFIFL